MILAGDVGGTKTLLGLFERSGGRLLVRREASFRSRDYSSLEAILEEFQAGASDTIEGFCVGVAGPVVAGRSQVVNVRWPVDAGRLSRQLDIPEVSVINDLEATAWGIGELSSKQSVTLTPRLRASPANAALIAAGTGLGMALLCWDGTRHVPCASEGGHQDFGPRDDLEIELLRYLRPRFGRVSIERLVAGPGLSSIYQFLVDSGRVHESGAMAERLDTAPDTNAAIAEAGMEGSDAAAEQALDLFVSLYGSAAGDLALVARALGGVWIGGGIAPKILPRLRSGAFVHAFRDKGRMAPLLEQIPIRVILEPRTALLGSAAFAFARQAGGSN